MAGGLPILYVEDDAVDVMILERAFARCGIDNRLVVARHGEEALAALRADGDAALRPGLILLDLNMPVMNGFELLAALEGDAALRHIPKLVLTSSRRESDRRRSYELGAAGFIEKPLGFDAFVRALEILRDYWALCEAP
jgi:CheY-like chemotaxis protein